MSLRFRNSVPIQILILLVASLPIFALASTTDIPYLGSALDGTIHVGKLQTLIASIDSLACRQSAERTGLPLDRNRLRLFLEDVPVGLTRFHTAMLTGGYDTTTVKIRAQIWLRSAANDSVAALRTLTHEYVHAILRQHLRPEEYARVPEWFQEGAAVHLAEQHPDRLQVALAHRWQNPESLYAGLSDGPSDDDYLAGSWWFMALDRHHGPDATRRLLGALIAERNLFGALTAIGCSIEEIWRLAEQDAATEVQALTQDVASHLRTCMEARADDRALCRDCFCKLIEEHPDTYAAEYALFWAAKLSYEQQHIQDAYEYLTRLEHCRRQYGKGDDMLYLRILLEYDRNQIAKARRYCEDYFGLWPDGIHYQRVQSIYQQLY